MADTMSACASVLSGDWYPQFEYLCGTLRDDNKPTDRSDQPLDEAKPKAASLAIRKLWKWQTIVIDDDDYLVLVVLTQRNADLTCFSFFEGVLDRVRGKFINRKRHGHDLGRRDALWTLRGIKRDEYAARLRLRLQGFADFP